MTNTHSYTRQQIAISPYDLLESNFRQSKEISSSIAKRIKGTDNVVYYSKLLENKKGQKFVLDCQHRFSTKTYSGYHCFVFSANIPTKGGGKTFKRFRVTEEDNNMTLPEMIGKFLKIANSAV